MKSPLSTVPALRSGIQRFFSAPVRKQLLAQANPGNYPRKIDPFVFIAVFAEAFLRLCPSLHHIAHRFASQLATPNVSTLSYALGSRLHRSLIIAMLDSICSRFSALSIKDIVVLDSMAICFPRTRQHNCRKMNNKTAGGGILWALCVTASRSVCPVQILSIMEGGWHDAKVMEKVRLIAKGPLYVMDRGFYAIRHLNQWLDEGVRFLIRARGKSLIYSPLRHMGRARGLRAKVTKRGAARTVRVIFDGIAVIGGPQCRTARPTVRLLVLRLKRGNKIEELTLVSSELKAEAQALLDAYGRRWEIEEFHRVLKRCAGLAHLYSFRQEGITTLAGIVALLAVILWLDSRLLIDEKGKAGRKAKGGKNEPNAPTIPQVMRQLLKRVRRIMGVADPWRPNTIGKVNWRHRK